MPITREELYEQVWLEPAGKVAARHGVSGSYLAQVCRRLRVPRPDRGYWAKLAAGKKVVKAQLPKARPGDEQIWAPDVPQWQRHRAMREPDLQPPVLRPEQAATVAKGRRRHRLLDGVDELFRRGEHRRDGYLRPATRQLPDISVSEARLDDAIAVASALFNSLESRGHDVVLAPNDQPVHRDIPAFPGDERNYYDRSRWSPAKATVTYLGTVAFGLAIIERSVEMDVESVNERLVPLSSAAAQAKLRAEPWRTRMGSSPGFKVWMPSGELQIYAYCPYQDAKWSRSWSAETLAKLREQIPDIVAILEAGATKLIADIHAGRARRKEEERKQAIEWEVQKAKWAEEQRKRALEELRKTLLQVAREWVETEEIRRFLGEAEAQSESLSEPQRAALKRRLHLARQLLWLPTASEQLLRVRLQDENETSP